MQKDFDSWNKKKKQIDEKEERLFFRTGEIWWVNLGLNIGYEANGKSDDFMRPVIILKKFNEFSFIGVPLSTSPKTNKYRIPVGMVDEKKAFANLSQIRNLDSKRLINKVGHLEAGKLVEINKKISRVNFG